MQKIQLITVGGLKEAYLRQAAAEYQKRLAPLCALETLEIREARLPADPSPAEIARALEAEGRDILRAVPPGNLLVALCIEGRQMPSERFAAWLQKAAVEGARGVSFVIGGSFGLAPAVKTAAALRLSVSEMTFPHQLFRVMLLEQLYRAYSILAGAKYHK